MQFNKTFIKHRHLYLSGLLLQYFGVTQFIYCTLIGFMSLVMVTSCKKFVTVSPPKTQVAGEVVFTSDAMAASVMNGIYSRMSNSSGFSSGDFSSVTFVTALSADELKNFSTSNTQAEFYNNSLSTSNNTVYSSLWLEPYQYIYTANYIIEGMEKSNISNGLKQQLQGESLFVRAFCYFYLVNMFGDVPLVTKSDYTVNQALARANKSDVYKQIIADLVQAQSLLSDNYLTSTGITTLEKVRPNKYAANALLARVYLYTGDWSNAENLSTTIIANTSKYSLVGNLDSVFLKNSKEAIWQLMPVTAGINTKEGNRFILTTTPTLASLRDDFKNSFDSGDKRANNWVSSTTVGANTYYYPYKYKIKNNSTLSEYSMVLRLGELYLVRAEARAQQNKTTEALSDINAIRVRAGLNSINLSDKNALLLEIEKQRKFELFTEWGHRWFDLKRTNRVDAVLSAAKGANWQTTDQLYPIPNPEILVNQNLVQNQGY